MDILKMYEIVENDESSTLNLLDLLSLKVSDTERMILEQLGGRNV